MRDDAWRMHTPVKMIENDKVEVDEAEMFLVSIADRKLLGCAA